MCFTKKESLTKGCKEKRKSIPKILRYTILEEITLIDLN